MKEGRTLSCYPSSEDTLLQGEGIEQQLEIIQNRATLPPVPGKRTMTQSQFVGFRTDFLSLVPQAGEGSASSQRVLTVQP